MEQTGRPLQLLAADGFHAMNCSWVKVPKSETMPWHFWMPTDWYHAVQFLAVSEARGVGTVVTVGGIGG